MPPKAAIINKDAAKRLRLVREYLNLSQADLSEATGVNQSTIAKMELGHTAITSYILERLFIKFNISPLYIVVGKEGIEYKVEKKTLITDTRQLRAEMLVMRAELEKAKQDINILSRSNLVPKS